MYFQYGVGEHFGGHISQRANRFIISRDITNSGMLSTICLTPGWSINFTIKEGTGGQPFICRGTTFEY